MNTEKGRMHANAAKPRRMRRPFNLVLFQTTPQRRMKKTHVAFQMSAERLAKRGKLYFWTFTHKQKFDIEETRFLWNHLLTLLRRRWPDMCGLRVFEMHKNHGLHVHLLTDGYLDINEARSMARRAGWGRIHVKRIPASKAGYMGKYLSKERPPCFKGWRLWAAFGKKWEWTKVSDLERDSAFARVYRHFSDFFGWEGNRGFSKRSELVAQAIQRQISEAGKLRQGAIFREVRRSLVGGDSVVLW